ncbi:MAG: phosphoribosylglycinamide formyltransferase [Arcobacteraceae bacterium]
MKKIGILSSHNGSGFDTIVSACENQSLDAQVVVVISNNTHALVLQKAQQKNIPNFVVNGTSYPHENVDEKITALLQEYHCDVVFLSGYMKKIGNALLEAFPNAIINSHPALLPKFGGAGMYGSYVHEAVIKAKEKKSGCTIHFVNEHYDEGEYILQKSINLEENETIESLENKIKHLESVTIIEALNTLFDSN